MTLDAMIESDQDDVFFNTDDFAKTCTYTSFDTGVSVPNIPVILGIGTGLARNEDGAADSDTAFFKISSIALPKRNDYFVCGSTKYTVLQRLQGDSYRWKLFIEADQRQNPKG